MVRRRDNLCLQPKSLQRRTLQIIKAGNFPELNIKHLVTRISCFAIDVQVM
jgi:hypothetical protein